ncbi:DNA glycosylase [Martensiomyces pterosporus]|nr:DNA glycosylase [Martensiomyces pterosporus]
MALSRGKEDDTSYISLCESIIYQQLAGKAAAAILLKFLKRYGKLKDESKAPLLDQENSGLDSGDFIFPSPELVATLDVAEMKAVGLGQRKAEYLKEVASKFNDGTLSDSMLASLPDEDVSKALVAIRGIGQWTADMFLMFHLKRANVLPTLDLAIRKAMCHHFGAKFGKNTPTHDEMVEMGRIWEPYRSVATWYMWQTMSTVTQEK